MEERHVNICELADEVLVHIFSFLPSYDVISVSATCERFRKVCSEKRIVKSLDFSKCYHLHSSDLHLFLQPKTRRLNIKVLNLNFCYWLKANIYGVIPQLKNLKELHVLECKVGLTSLIRIVSKLELDALSWTWDSNITNEAVASVQAPLSQLKQLHIQLTNVFQLSQLVAMLQFCNNLEELTVSKRSRCTAQVNLAYAAIQERGAPPRVALHHLRRLYILLDGNQGVDVTRFAQELLSVCSPDSQWETVWTSENGCSVLAKLCDQRKISLMSLANARSLNLSGSKSLQFQIIRNDSSRSQIEFINKFLLQKSLPKWRHLSLDLLKIPADLLGKLAKSCTELQYVSMQDCALQGQPSQVIEGLSALTSCQNLTYLNLSRTHIHSPDLNPCLALAKLKALQYLAFPACYLANTSSVVNSVIDNQETIVFKPKRVGLKTNIDVVKSNSRLLPLTEGCPLLKRLVVSGNTIDNSCLQLCSRVTDDDFYCIQRWKKLESFSLSCLQGIRHGKFLESLAANCPELNCLTLVSLGPSGTCTYSGALIQALKYCHKLRDIRILQHGLDLTAQMFEGIQMCSNLERLSLSAQNSALNGANILHVVEKLERLIMIYLLTDTPVSVCKKLEKVLTRRFVKRRPAFSAHVISRLAVEDSLEGMPTFHLEEMTCTQPTTVFLPE